MVMMVKMEPKEQLAIKDPLVMLEKMERMELQDQLDLMVMLEKMERMVLQVPEEQTDMMAKMEPKEQLVIEAPLEPKEPQDQKETAAGRIPMKLATVPMLNMMTRHTALPHQATPEHMHKTHIAHIELSQGNKKKID